MLLGQYQFCLKYDKRNGFSAQRSVPISVTVSSVTLRTFIGLKGLKQQL